MSVLIKFVFSGIISTTGAFTLFENKLGIIKIPNAKIITKKAMAKTVRVFLCRNDTDCILANIMASSFGIASFFTMSIETPPVSLDNEFIIGDTISFFFTSSSIPLLYQKYNKLACLPVGRYKYTAKQKEVLTN